MQRALYRRLTGPAIAGLLALGMVGSAGAAPARKPARPQPKARPKPAAPVPVAPAKVPSAPTEQDLQFDALMDETFKKSAIQDDMTMVWWIADEFWQMSLKSAPDLTPDQVNEALALLGNYTIVMAAEGSLVGGKASYQPAAEVRKALSVVMPDGTTLKPLPPDQVGETANAIVAVMKPIFANNFGPFGKNLHLYFFPAKDAEGRRLLDARAKGVFTVLVRGRELKWRLPLSSLVPRKECPTCKEKLSGAYGFCPYDGARLP